MPFSDAKSLDASESTVLCDTAPSAVPVAVSRVRKDEAILALKGVAIIGVVSFHLLNRRLDPETLRWLTPIPLALQWCVLAFLCASGYLHALADTRRFTGALEFVFSRCKRLLLPFLIFSLLFNTAYHFIQHSGLIAARPDIPSGFVEKLRMDLWPIGATTIEHLYFLPLLFFIAVSFRLLLLLVRNEPSQWCAISAVWIVAAAGFPNAGYTGFSLGLGVWGLALYGTGYLFSKTHAKGAAVWPILAAATLLAMLSGPQHLPRVIPLYALFAFSSIELVRIKPLCMLGEASGTIYIYHTPFLLQPLLVMCSLVPGVPQQFALVLLAAAIVMAICAAWHFATRNTRLAWTLL